MSFVDSFLIPGIGLGELIHSTMTMIMIAIIVMFMDNFPSLAIGMTRIVMALLIMMVLLIMTMLLIMVVLLIMLVLLIMMMMLQGGDGEQFWGEQTRISSLVPYNQHIGEAAGSLHCC